VCNHQGRLAVTDVAGGQLVVVAGVNEAASKDDLVSGEHASPQVRQINRIEAFPLSQAEGTQVGFQQRLRGHGERKHCLRAASQPGESERLGIGRKHRLPRS
jgi:hypothetical protein